MSSIHNKKIGAIVQARKGSSRLPGKVLKNLSGSPMLVHVLDRLKLSRTFDEIIVATTNLAADSEIVKIAKTSKVLDFEANCAENDVLTRYLQAAQKYSIDVIVRVTSDCPLIDYQLLDGLVEEFFKQKVDYISNCRKPTFPDGVSAEVFFTDCLARSSGLSDKIEEREHVVIPMRNHPELFKSANIEAEGTLRRPDIRITVDTPEDFKVIEEIYKALYKPDKIYFSTLEVIEFLDNNPEIKRINKHSINKSRL